MSTELAQCLRTQPQEECEKIIEKLRTRQPLGPKELIIISQDEWIAMTPQQKRDYAEWVNKLVKGWIKEYIPSPAEINKMLATREWSVLTPQGMMIKTVPTQKRRQLIQLPM